MTIRILIADDHAIVRDGLKSLLQAADGVTVVGEVSNGHDIVDRAAELKPDVVLMDIAMPELNGIEATRLLRVRAPEVRVVMLSMHSDAEYVHRALEAGAAGYVLKESAVPEVLAAVHAVYAGKPYFSAAVRDAVAARSGAHAVSPLDSLSPRERQVLQLVVEGHSSAEIAEIVHLSPKTVATYRSRLTRKLGVSDLPALVKFAIEHGVTS